MNCLKPQALNYPYLGELEIPKIGYYSNMIQHDYGIVVLAAGGSKRLGFPKQLLEINGESFLHRITSEIEALGWPSVVVLGSDSNRMEREVASEKIHIHCNIDWQKGIGTSIKSGVKALHDEAPGLKAMIIMPCDQPYISAEVLNNLKNAHQAGHPLVAASYNHTYGTPVLFDMSMYKELTMLKATDDLSLIMQMHTVFGVPFSLGAYDVNTEDDWKSLYSLEKSKSGF